MDFVSVNEMTGNQQVVEKGLRDRVEPSDKIMSVEGLYVIFPKSTANGRVLQYKFNQELEKMKQSGGNHLAPRLRRLGLPVRFRSLALAGEVLVVPCVVGR